MQNNWPPIKIIELDLAQPLGPITALSGYSAVYLLIRYYGQPLGWIWLPITADPVITPAQLYTAIDQQLGWQLVPLVLGGQLKIDSASDAALVPISIVLYSPSPSHHLQACLGALLGLDYPDYEILIISHRPECTVQSRPAGQPPVHYIYEPQVGLNRARNRGVIEARHNIIAFIDERARPDRDWLKAIARAFSEVPNAAAVTGLVAPAQLETKAQIRFEFDYGGLGRGFNRQIIRRDALTRLGKGKKKREQQLWLWRDTLAQSELLFAQQFGSGSNMAFRRDVFTKNGLFDLTFDCLPHGAGGDIEMFHRLVMQGCTLLYEPAVLVWRVHERDEAELNQLASTNGKAFGFYLLTCAHKRTLSRRSILNFSIYNWLWKQFIQRLYKPGKLPRRIILSELAGALASPFIYAAVRIGF